MSRSQSARIMWLATSPLTVNFESPRNRDSPLTLLDWPGSQYLASPFPTRVLTARSASAPPCASTACLTRSSGPDCADAGCAWLTASSSAAEIMQAYFIPILPSCGPGDARRRLSATGERSCKTRLTRQNDWRYRLGTRASLHARLHRVLHILELFDLDVAQLAVHLFDAANVDRLDHVARL